MMLCTMQVLGAVISLGVEIWRQTTASRWGHYILLLPGGDITYLMPGDTHIEIAGMRKAVLCSTRFVQVGQASGPEAKESWLAIYYNSIDQCLELSVTQKRPRDLIIGIRFPQDIHAKKNGKERVRQCMKKLLGACCERGGVTSWAQEKAFEFYHYEEIEDDAAEFVVQRLAHHFGVERQAPVISEKPASNARQPIRKRKHYLAPVSALAAHQAMIKIHESDLIVCPSHSGVWSSCFARTSGLGSVPFCVS